MDYLEQIVKPLTLLIGTLAPVLKSFFGHMANRTRHLDVRYSRIKTFFDDGATARHPLLVEASFASAVGHSKLNAHEIELVLRQPRPTGFMTSYLRARDYVGPTEAGDQFELRGIAKHDAWRKTLVVLGIAIYILLAGPAIWTILYVIPMKAFSQQLPLALATMGFCSLAIALACIALMGSAKLHIAATLFKRQVKPIVAAGPTSLLAPVSMDAGLSANEVDSSVSTA